MIIVWNSHYFSQLNQKLIAFEQIIEEKMKDNYYWCTICSLWQLSEILMIFHRSWWKIFMENLASVSQSCTSWEAGGGPRTKMMVKMELLATNIRNGTIAEMVQMVPIMLV